MNGDAMNGADREGARRSTSHRTNTLPEDSLIQAIGDVGRTVDQLQINIARQIRELTEYVNQCEKHHQADMAHWRTVTEELAQLLQVKTQATEEVSSSYVKLVEYLARFSNYLMMSEMTLSRAEPSLLSLSKVLPTLSESSGAPQTAAALQLSQGEIQSLLAALTEVKEANQQMQGGMRQLLHLHRGKKETSIWTDLANWRAAVVWVGVGAITTASLLFWVLRGSGFQQAVRAVNLQGEVLTRLERIEVWLGIDEGMDENPEFEEQAFPEE